MNLLHAAKFGGTSSTVSYLNELLYRLGLEGTVCTHDVGGSDGIPVSSHLVCASALLRMHNLTCTSSFRMQTSARSECA